MRLQWFDREEIVSATMERMVRALMRKGGVGEKPIGAATVENVEWAIADFRRSRVRRAGREQLTAPEEILERPADWVPAPVEQADGVAALFRPLGPRERQILFERHVLEMEPGEVAARHEASVPAIKMACSRAGRKAREHRQNKSDVTHRAPASIYTDEAQTSEAAPPDGQARSTRTRARSGQGAAGAKEEGPRVSQSGDGKTERKKER